MPGLNELFTTGEYQRCVNIAESRFGVMLKGMGVAPREIVHEIYIRLACGATSWSSLVHFRWSYQQSIRHLVIDTHRRSLKRASEVPIDACPPIQAEDDAVQALELEDELEQLAKGMPRQARVVYTRFVAGYTINETATRLGISSRTVKRDSGDAISWLRLRYHD